AEELALLAGLAGEGDRQPGERLGLAARLVALGRVLRVAGLLLTLHPALVALGRLVRQALGQEEVARVAGLDAHQLSRLAEVLHIFPEDHFHHRSAPEVGGAFRRLKSSHVSARPKIARPIATNGKKNSA